LQRIRKEDLYYPKNDFGRRFCGELSMIPCTPGKNGPSLWPRTRQLNGLKPEPKISLMSVISQITGLHTLLSTTIKFIPLEKSNMKLIKHNIYAKERNI
jgi:hypothetical protein